MPALIVGLSHGLGNRLLPLISAIRLARLWGYDLYVTWDPALLKARQEAIFAQPFADPEAILHHGYYVQQQESKGVQVIDREQTKGRNIYIRTTSIFSGKEDIGLRLDVIGPQFAAAFRSIAWSAQVLERLDECGLSNGDCLGVHIRRPAPIEILPYQWELPSDLFYAQASRQLVDAFRLKEIYISTNSETSKGFMQGYFAALGLPVKSIQAHTYNFIDDEIAGVDAAVDIILLSRCHTIFRRQISSFSWAAAIGGGVRHCAIDGAGETHMKDPLVW